MKNLRNKNQPPNADLVQVYLQSSWDKVVAVYGSLDDITTVADAINGGQLGNYLQTTDIDTLAELNAIVLDATLGDAADFATAAQGAKVDFLTVTQAVDLDAIEARVNELDQSVVLKGTWDASSGSFPGGGTAQAGESWIVSVAGTVDSVDFAVDDRIIAILDNASTSTFAANWHKADYSDVVTSVATLTGSITAGDLRTQLNVEDGATADQTGAEIKALYEAEADTNAFTDALLTKLTGIETSATQDQTDAEIKTAYENLTTVVSQAEAEAGVATTVRLWTAERVGQAIAALGGGGGLTWNIQGDANFSPLKDNGYVVDGLTVDRTATLPASPSVGDTLVIWNNDGTGGFPYDVLVDAGGSNEITERNINYVSQMTLPPGDLAQLVCYDAGATKRWYVHRARTANALTSGGGGMTVTTVKTGNYTAAAGEFVPVDSSGGSFTITLPAGPGAQDRVVIWDFGKQCGVNPVTVARNGNTIDGAAEDFLLDQSNGRIDTVFDGTSDWDTGLIGTPEVININDYATGFGGVNAQTGTTYTFVDADLAELVTASNASASTYSIPDSLAAVGETLNVLNIGAGTVTVDCPGTDTLASTANDLATGKAGTIIKTAATTWWLVGGA